MTQSVAENSNNDFYLGDDGNIAFVTALAAVAQLCVSRVEAQRGEMIYAADQGMPTRATAWDQFNPNQFEAAARAIILATPDVTAVTSFTLTRQGNDLVYSADISTIYGSTTVSNAT
jgi:hypothetical protein